jgi:PAS domain S-box-containing protein
MKIQTKTILIITGMCLLIIAGVGLISQTLVLDGFARLEEKHLDDTLDQTVRAIHHDQQFMLKTAHDWAVWDDSYSYIQGFYPDYPAVNLYDDIFEYLNLDIIIYTRLDGTVIYGKGLDSETGEQIEIPPEIFTIHHIFIESGEGKLIDTVQTERGPALIAVKPILMSSGEGPMMGTLLFARFIDDDFIEGISEQIGVPIRIGTDLAPDGAQIITISDDGLEITGTRILTDSEGEPILTLSITLHRDIYEQGVRSLQSVLAFIVIFSLVTSIILYILVNHFIVSRIHLLNSEVEEITQHPNAGGTVQVSGHDELAFLAGSVNRMLHSIEADQEKIRESEARFRSFVSLAPVGIVILDRNWKLIYASSKFVELFGYTKDDVPDLDTWWTHSLPDEIVRAGIRKEWDSARLDAGEPPSEMRPLYYQVTTRDLRVLHIEMRVASTEDLNIIVFSDITERKHAEEAFHIANKKLKILSSITRHDILNQIMVLQGYLELAAEMGGDETQAEYLGKVRGAAAAIHRQIGFTRTYEDLGVEEPQWLSVSGALSGMRGGPLPIQYECATYQILADPMLEKVFANLMDNTIRYAEGATRVQIHCEEQDGNLLISFEDDGPGVPDDQKERIFERGVGKNTGFGLFLSREILAITGIAIRETGVYGKGARFEMLVPVGKWRREDISG